jgi:hypothetical protein
MMYWLSSVPQVAVYTYLVPYIGGNKHGKRNANRKAEYIDKREKLVFPDVSPGNGKVVVQHRA